jgi:hypothetical protein
MMTIADTTRQAGFCCVALLLLIVCFGALAALWSSLSLGSVRECPHSTLRQFEIGSIEYCNFGNINTFKSNAGCGQKPPEATPVDVFRSIEFIGYASDDRERRDMKPPSFVLSGRIAANNYRDVINDVRHGYIEVAGYRGHIYFVGKRTHYLVREHCATSRVEFFSATFRTVTQVFSFQHFPTMQHWRGDHFDDRENFLRRHVADIFVNIPDRDSYQILLDVDLADLNARHSYPWSSLSKSYGQLALHNALLLIHDGPLFASEASGHGNNADSQPFANSVSAWKKAALVLESMFLFGLSFKMYEKSEKSPVYLCAVLMPLSALVLALAFFLFLGAFGFPIDALGITFP